MMKRSEILIAVGLSLILVLIGLGDPKIFEGNALSAVLFIEFTLLIFLFRRFQLIKPIWTVIALFWMVLLAFFIGNYILQKFRRK